MVDNNGVPQLAGSKRKTEITIETHTTTVIRVTSDGSPVAFCRTCGADSPDLSLHDAAAILNVSRSELLLFADSGDIHMTERGGLCGKSLVEHKKLAVPHKQADQR
jgi:hypothetical protein